MEEKPKTEKSEEAQEVILPKEEYERILTQVRELETTREDLLRRAADYDNARKRLAKEREEFVKFSQERLIRELLPVLDNLERALAHLEEALPEELGAGKSLQTGLQMISKQLFAALSNQGLKRISAQGRLFDPHQHETVGQVEEEGPEGIVVHEVARGYLLHDRVVRPAKVRIRVHPGKATPGGAPAAKAEEKEEEIT